MVEFENIKRKLEEKFLENKVYNMDSEKREKFLEDYATYNYLIEIITAGDILESKFYGESFSFN